MKVAKMMLSEPSIISPEVFSDVDFGYIFAMGFEDRALAFPAIAARSPNTKVAVGIQYTHSKGDNKEGEATRLFKSHKTPFEIVKYSSKKAHEFEYKVRALCKGAFKDTSDVVVDISAMSKFLILVIIVVLLQEGKRVRIAFASACEYAPTKEKFESVLSQHGSQLTAFAGQPSTGVSAILRSVCISSTRMQGQPVCAVAFTSFNEELIRHSVGTLNPHRLILINGIPPNPELRWRANATQEIHRKLLEEYAEENPISSDTGLLERSVSTLDYRETVEELLRIRTRFGNYSRIIYFATGSKMQTVALALLKAVFSDVHIEYPTPDSYYFQEYSKGIGSLCTLTIDQSSLDSVRELSMKYEDLKV